MGFYCLYENMGRGFVCGTTWRYGKEELQFTKEIENAAWFSEVGLHSFLKTHIVDGSMIVYSLDRFCNATDFIRKTYNNIYGDVTPS